MSSYVPGLSGGADAEVGVRAALGVTIADGTGVPGVVRGVIRVKMIGGSWVKKGGGSSASVGVTDSSGEGSVEIPGSVPRKMYLNGVSVSVTKISARDAL